MEAKNAKNYPVAIENFEKAPPWPPPSTWCGRNWRNPTSVSAIRKSGAEQQAAFDKGIAAYAKAVEIKADDPNYHNNYALALAKGKKMDQAQAELTKAAQTGSATSRQVLLQSGRGVRQHAAERRCRSGLQESHRKWIPITPTRITRKPWF